MIEECVKSLIWFSVGFFSYTFLIDDLIQTKTMFHLRHIRDRINQNIFTPSIKWKVSENSPFVFLGIISSKVEKWTQNRESWQLRKNDNTTQRVKEYLSRFHKIKHMVPQMLIIQLFDLNGKDWTYFLKRGGDKAGYDEWFNCNERDTLQYCSTISFHCGYHPKPPWASIPWPLNQLSEINFHPDNLWIEINIDLKRSPHSCQFSSIQWNHPLFSPNQIVIRCHEQVLLTFEKWII